MNYKQALSYIENDVWQGSRPGLSRISELARRLGSPQKGMRFVHVAGTNGKGSVCASCARVLQAAGYNVGLYISPYIVRFNERMSVCGEPISDGELASLTTLVRAAASTMEDKPTEFELITALAFLYFRLHRCDVVVLEVGMGGRLDATNIIEAPLVSVITGIALDHVGILGDTVEKIAREKAGIIKPGVPVVYGGRDDAAFSVISARARELGCPVVRTDLASLHTISSSLRGNTFGYKGEEHFISLAGAYQPENAATAVEALRILESRGLKIGARALAEGLGNVHWRARFELLGEDPAVVYDGSHNVQGVAAAAKSIADIFGGEKPDILMGVLADKDYKAMVALLAPYVRRVITVTPPSPRALSAFTLADVWRQNGVKAEPFSDIASAVEAAYLRALKEHRPLVILGSLYMYGSVYSAFFRLKSLAPQGV